MLPGSSCRMVEFLAENRLLVGCERAADLRQHLGRRDRACPPVGVGHQVLEALTLVGVGARPATATRCGWRPGRRWGCRPAPAARPARRAGLAAAATPWGVDAKVVQDHHGDAAASLGAGHHAARLGAEWYGAAAVGHGPVQVPLAPVHQPKAVLLGVL